MTPSLVWMMLMFVFANVVMSDELMGLSVLSKMGSNRCKNRRSCCFARRPRAYTWPCKGETIK